MIAFDRSSSYHTHSCFCDGRDTPEELAQEALRLGCAELGFSGHAYTGFDGTWCMSREGTEQYKSRVRALQRQYAGRLVIRLGVEQDYASEEPTDGYDYVIGSVHYVYRDGAYLPVDESPECQRRAAEQYYGGDFYAFAEDYYRTVADVYRKTHCDIVGHFDLISKFNERGELFDPDHPRYRSAAMTALETLAAEPTVFEINHGAVARGLRSQPYPAQWMLDYLLARGCTVLHTSDCHDRRNLLFGIRGE